MSKSLELYRNILRLHRSLPEEMRKLGDLYVKSEFRAHRTLTNQMQILEFLHSWTLYKNSIKAQVAAGLKGEKINLEELKDEQILQLDELRSEIKKKV